jgi:zinc protease
MRRLLALLLVVGLVAGACSSDDPAPTTAADPLALPSFPDDDIALGVDTDVRIGTLDNGLTYYIRENDSPGGRAQLRLAVHAGSIQETDDQRGVAHFLEHMAFNGTTRFPANELVLVLQRFGAEFGPDINAYTSYEETVYELELPTDDPATVAAGFDVLAEWAGSIALDPAEIDLERGVMIEEWRLRDQNFWGRYFAGVTEVLLGDTDYADRDPLADPDQVNATTRNGLADFYDRWYRPDTMAIVAVGDFDADEIEDLITDRFSDLEARGDTDPVPEPTTEAASEPTFFVLADPEYPQAWAELNYPLPALGSPATVGSVRSAMAFDLAWDAIVARMEEQSVRSDVPYFDPSFAANPLVRGQRTPGLAAFAEPQDLGPAAEALLTEVRRAELHGFESTELDRVIAERRSAVELAYDERSTTQDGEYADAYVEHFLGGGQIASADEWRDVQLRLLDEMTAEYVAEVFSRSVGSTEPFVILVTPEAAAGDVPSEDELAEIVARVDAADIARWEESATTITALMERPAPAEIADRSPFADTGLTELTLENGARVVFLPTTIRDDVVVLLAASPGGWAVVEAGDAAEAQLAPRIVSTSGLDDFDQVDLDRFLSGVNAEVSPYVDETTEGFFGQAATRDIESLLQLVHLYMTAPRFEERARDVVIAETLPFAVDLDLVPDLAAATALADVRFGGDTRFRPIPPPEELEAFDLEAAGAAYRDRFDDPGDFVFAFVGDFDEEELEDLVRRYLGTIPGPGDVDGFVDVRPQPPAGTTDLTVTAGTGVLGGVTLLHSAETPLDSATRIEIDLLVLILQQRLTERIREELSASYSPFAFATLIEDAEQSVDIQIQISGDPDGLDAVIEATLDELVDLRDNGPTSDQLAIAREQLRRDYELLSNEGLAQAVIFAALHPGESLAQVTARIEQTGDASAADLQDLAQTLLPPDRYIVVRLVPAA